MYGFDESDIPAGYRDADIETRELEEAAGLREELPADVADGIPFGQPILVGHHSEGRARRDQARMEQGMRASVDSARMAGRHAEKAAGLEEQLARSIYSDDVDAVERLEEKLARLEERQARMKARNGDYRKTHAGELRGMGAYERSQAVPHAGYELTNNGAEIRRCRERLETVKREQLQRAAGVRGRGRQMVARFASSCAACGGPIEKGAVIVYYRATKEAVHDNCQKEA